MAVFRTVIRSDLQKPLVVQQLSGNMFTADNASNEIAVEVTNGGEPVALSGAVTAYAVRADGVTAMFSGTINGNAASVVLPASCYVEVGTLSIVIKVGTTTVGACTCYVYRTTTDEIVDPGHVIPSIDELLEQIDACRTATTNANTAASSANTAAGNANTKAGLAETAAGNANTAAGKIDNMTVEATTLPAGSQATVSVTEVSGHKHIVFGVPKGESGNETIDDTAGAGDTDKTWSADKSTKEVTDLKSALSDLSLLFVSEIEDTVQTLTRDAAGSVNGMIHSRDGSAVRTDTYVKANGVFTETRTLADGRYITLVTDLDTKITTISDVQEAA